MAKYPWKSLYSYNLLFESPYKPIKNIIVPSNVNSSLLLRSPIH